MRLVPDTCYSGGVDQLGRWPVIGRIALPLAAIVAATFSLGVTFFTTESTAAAEITNVTSIADVRILENAPTTNYGGATILGADGDDPSGSGKDKYALLKWDLAGIAPGTKISSASVTLSVTSSSPRPTKPTPSSGLGPSHR